MVGGAAAGVANTPAGHPQSCVAGLKVCWVLDSRVVVVDVKSINMLSGLLSLHYRDVDQIKSVTFMLRCLFISTEWYNRCITADAALVH